MSAVKLFLDDLTSFGQDTGHGNLLGVQTAMLPEDYASPEALYAKLAGYLAVAADKGWLRPDTIVIFPEYIGAWLVAVRQKRSVYQAQTIDGALRTLVLANLVRFLRARVRARGQDKIRDTVFRMQASRMAAAYQQVFGLLARTHPATIVAGSIILPEPQVINGQLSPGNGPLQNCAFVFHSDGSLDSQITRKVFPIRSEQPFLAAALPGQLPVYQTPAGRLGVLVCADSWYPQTYQAFAKQGAKLLAVPAYLSPDGIWDQPWAGYSGHSAPPEVDPADIGQISEGQAWLKYSLAGRMQTSGAVTGMQVFLRGRIWDLGSDGHAIAVTPHGVYEAAHIQGGALVNCWIS
jgi:predicted amidohydrolase